MTERCNRLINAFSSFLLVGGVGFLVDGALLTILTHFRGWTPWQARVPSFLTAVMVTWLLNRRYTFPGRGLQRRSTEALLYLGTQACGAGINLAVFGACLAWVPRLHDFPIVALAAGSAAGLAFNFGVSNFVLYSSPRAAPDRLP